MIRRLLGASLLGLSLGGLVYISDEWKEAILAEHNRERAVYHEPPYIWSDAIAQQAARKADSCVGSHSSWASREYASEACNSPTCKHNENLAYMASDINPCQTNWPKWVEMWNSERVGYDCANNSQIPNEPGYGHWSQVVWSGTRYLGCALRCGCREDHGTWFGQFLVCHYGKTGNILGKRPFSTTECKYHLGGGGDDGGSYNVACEEHGVGLYDSNMGSVVVPGVMTAKACAETCRHEKEHGCRHFTFYDGCWLHWGSTGKRPTGGSLVASMSCLYPDDFKSAPDPPQKRCDQVNVQAINPVMVVPGKIAGAATPWECAQACKNYEGYGCQFFQLSGYDCLLLKSAQALQWADGHTFGVLSCYGLT